MIWFRLPHHGKATLRRGLFSALRTWLWILLMSIMLGVHNAYHEDDRYLEGHSISVRQEIHDESD